MALTYNRSVFVGPNKLRIDEIPIPEPVRGKHGKVKACAICTWEQRMYTGENLLSTVPVA